MKEYIGVENKVKNSGVVFGDKDLEWKYSLEMFKSVILREKHAPLPSHLPRKYGKISLGEKNFV